MKNIFLYLICAVLLLASCNNEEQSQENGKTIQINISLDGLDTKATIAGNDELNENKVTDLDLFMYNNGEPQAKVYKHLSTDIVSNGTVNLHLSNTELTRLGYALGNSFTFKIFAIANRPEGTAVTGAESVEELGNKTIQSSKPFNQKQDSFVMTGECTATGGAGSAGFNAALNLKRIACKLAISITATTPYDGEIGDGGNGTWLPQPAAATVKFYGSTPTGKINATPQRIATNNFESDRSLDVAAVYYSYPAKPLPENKPYYMITLPWKKDGSTTVKTTYYKIICDYDTLKRNTFYNLTVDITKIGSDEEPEPIILSPEALTFSTAEWASGVFDTDKYNTEAVIKDARFLVIYSEEYIMDNINSIDIPFTSSHDCSVNIVSTQWTDFSQATPVPRELSATQYKGNKDQTVAIDASGEYFTLSHTIINDFINNANFDICPITFTIDIKHRDREDYKQTITVIQKPAIVVQIQGNPYTRGATYVDNGQSTTNSWKYVSDRLYNDYTANMFIITVSALPNGSTYLIGDPRTLTPNNPSGTFATAATVNNSGTRTLTNYYPTRDDGTADNIIAPVLRTASGWGACYEVSYDNAKKRAAAYQEGGYPAGRWRMFTKAEAEFITRLATTNKIPPYFVSDNYYHIAGGSFRNGTIGATRSSAPVRFCYDEWYWSNTDYPFATPATSFAWGDLPR